MSETDRGEDLDALPDEAFRARMRAWVAANCPAHLRHPPRRLHWAETRPWYMALARQVWLAPGWPRAYGGMGLSPAKQVIFIEELERHGAPRTNDMGVTMIGPLLIRYGTEAKRARFPPRLCSGGDSWAQACSAPDAGSDRARLRTDAALDLAGEAGAMAAPCAGNRALNPGSAFIQSRVVSIHGGSNEIQRTIIARTLLGLPG